MIKRIAIPVFMLLFSFTSCSKESTENLALNETIDTTTTYKNVVESGAYQTLYKPQNGFVGDPMPYYNESDNNYYLYYLQDWRNGAPVDHPIYCVKSSDYSTFQGFTEAIPCGTVGSQQVFLGTGSFIKDNSGKLYCFYTGHNGSLFPAEKIFLATSTDMHTFTKVSSFSMQAPDGYDKNNFRDPCVYYDNTRACYVMLVTTIKDSKGVIARYTSTDLISWSLIAPLTDFESDAQILECPDIFQIGNKWYLVFSRINRDEHRKTFYRIADSPDGPWRKCTDIDGSHETFDGLYLYAGKTASDGRIRYLSGWCSTGQDKNANSELDWAGSLISHQIVQQTSGKLYPKIPDGVNKKFSTPVPFAKLKNKGVISEENGVYTINPSTSRGYILFNRIGTSVKVSMKIDASQSNKFGISFGASGKLEEIYSVAFDLTTTNKYQTPALFLNKENVYSTGAFIKELNFTPLIVPNNKIFDIKMIIEKSICVIYINDNVVFTNRIYRMSQNPWMIYTDSGTLKISELSIKRVP